MMADRAAFKDFEQYRHASAHEVVYGVLEKSLKPRKPLSVSEWSDAHRILSSKGSAMAGKWRTDRNPPMREPMDCMSARSTVHDAVLMWPVQFGKSEIAINAVGYSIDHAPCPVMVCLPGEVSMNKWIAQKLNPMIEETQVVHDAMTSTATRDGSNRREFKDFKGGQLYLEHAGSPARLKSSTVKVLIVDEYDEFAANFPSGDDPADMLDDRTSAFPSTYKRLYISSPQLKGISRTEAKWEKSDKRRYHVPCPHCGHLQHLEWPNLKFDNINTQIVNVRYVCIDCGCEIAEHHKTEMIKHGRWIAENPSAKIRGYHINCLYYQIGLGPRWATLAEMWIDAQNDPAKLKTFVNSRLAEPWEDQTTRKLRNNAIADRAEPYSLRTIPAGGITLTAGVDTQDNRLAVQIVAWGHGMAFWVIDYVELPGDPADDVVWTSLTELLNRPIQHELGVLLRVEAAAVDMGGHRTDAVKAFVRSRRIRRPMAIFGATASTAPVLGKGKAHDVNWKGQLDKRGVIAYQVGTVNAKHWLYGRMGVDAEKEASERHTHFSDELPLDYFSGVVSETYNPRTNRFEKKRGARNEPLDTLGYSYAAAHHPELRLHRRTKADWDFAAQRVLESVVTIDREAPKTDSLAQAQARPQEQLASTRSTLSASPKPKGRQW